MAAITPVVATSTEYRGPHQVSGTSAANQADTLTTAAQTYAQRLKYITVTYSAAPVQTGVTIELDSGLGAGYDATLFAGTANAQDTVYIPDVELPLMAGDAIKVSAPAGGGVITSNIAIVTERI